VTVRYKLINNIRYRVLDVDQSDSQAYADLFVVRDPETVAMPLRLGK
jgi:hypothetical protein